MNELMLTGWLPEVGGMRVRVGKRTGRALGASSVVLTSEGAKASEAVGGGGGYFGAKARSARATEGLGEGVGVRGRTGAGRSRVGRDRAEMGPRWGSMRSGRAPRLGRDLGEGPGAALHSTLTLDACVRGLERTSGCSVLGGGRCALRRTRKILSVHVACAEMLPRLRLKTAEMFASRKRP